MEKKIKHRILGSLVVIALVIILLPLLQRERDLPSEKVTVKAPPFPNQTMQVANALDEPKSEINHQPNTHNTQADNQPHTDDLMSVSRPSVINSQEPVETKQVAQIASKSTKTKKQLGVELANSVKVNKNIKHNSIKILSVSAKTNFDKNGLINLKNHAWVIQIGSFKNKTNAIRLVNQLRENGYHAFIQQVNTISGDSTRVFIGPEYKQTSARALASRLENDLHIHGMIISYKPLTL